MNLHKSYRQIFFVLIVGALLTVWVEPSYSDKIDKAYDHLDQGITLERKGLIREALELYLQAWDAAGIPEACFQLAEIYDKKFNDDKQAVKYYTKFLEFEDDTPLAMKAQTLLNKAKQDIVAIKKWKDDLSGKEISLSGYFDPILQELGVTPEKKAQELGRVEETGKKYPTQPTTCLACHGGYMGPDINMEATHPVGRIPTGELDETVPNEVRFYKEGRVICMSCHDPQIIHFSEGTEGKTYRTLRVATDGGEDMPRFCALCHSGKVSPQVIRSQQRRERDMDEEDDVNIEFEWEGRKKQRRMIEEDDLLDYERR